MNTFDLTLDLSKRGLVQVVPIRQGDKSGTTIRATITDHGAAAATSGLTARFQMRLPDGVHYYRKAASLSGNTATVVLDETQAASATGRTDVAYFQLLQGSTVVASTESFTLVVLPDALAGADVPESYDSAIQDAIDALDEAVEQMPDMVEDVLEAHPEWTTTVQDGSITEAKLATDLARDRERLLYRLANMLTATLPEGETATASDAAKTPMAGLALYGRSTQSGTPTPSAPVAIQSVTPNLYQQTYYAAGATHSTVGISIVHNEDGTCTCTGTATSSAWLWGGGDSADDRLYVTLPAGTYTACGSHYVVGQKKVDGTVSTLFNTTQGQRTFTLTETTDVKIVPVVPNGATVVNAIVWAALYGGPKAYPYVPYGYAGMWSIGKNLVTSDDLMWRHGGYNGTTGEETSSSTRMTLTKNAWFPVAPSTKYTVSVASGYKATVYRYDASGGFIAHQAGFVTGSGTFTTEANCAWCSVLVGRTDDGDMASEVPSSFGLQVEVGSTATAYQPYAESVTPIPLQGHTLRSLPDGTRDEVTVDQYGHAVLIKRVGMFDVTALATSAWTKSGRALNGYYTHTVNILDGGIALKGMQSGNVWCNIARGVSTTSEYFNNYGTTYIDNELNLNLDPSVVGSTVEEFKTWLAGHTVYLLGELTTPQTIDLGTIDPVALQGPDMTAQSVPTAPFALTYERDLNVTLARLEAALAALA